jgi:hypothetical protein
LREVEFDGRIEADIAVDDLAALVDDEERGNRVGAIEPRSSESCDEPWLADSRRAPQLAQRRPLVFQAAICSDLMNFHG